MPLFHMMLVQSLLASCVHSLRPQAVPSDLEASMLEASGSGCPAYRYALDNQVGSGPQRIINVPALKANQIIRYSCKAVATWEFTVDPQNTIRPNIGNRDIKDNYVTAECSSLAQLRRPHVLIFPTEELFKSAWCLRDQNDDGAQLSRNNGLYVGLACLNGACTPPSCFKSWEEPVRQPALQTK